MPSGFSFDAWHARFPPEMDALTLEQEALKLTPLARARLADRLQASLEDETSAKWDKAALAVARSRCEALDRGETTSVPVAEAVEQVRAALLKRR